MERSARSKLFSPLCRSPRTRSNSSARGPWPSKGPATVPVAMITGGLANWKVCSPVFFPIFILLPSWEDGVEQPDDKGGNHAEGNDRAGQREEFGDDTQDQAFFPEFQGRGDHGVGKTGYRNSEPGPGKLGDPVKKAKGGQEGANEDHGGHRRVGRFFRGKIHYRPEKIG